MDLFDQENLELTLKASNEGIWDWNVGEKEIYYSDRVYHFFGVESGTAANIMTHPEEILHPDHVAYFSNVLSLTLLDSDEDIFAVDCRIIKPSGVPCWLRIRGTVVWDGEQASRIAGSMIEITKRKQAEKLASEERNRMRLIIDNIPLQVYFKNTESKYVLVNQRQADWLGESAPEALIGKSGADYFSDLSWKESRAEEVKIMESGREIIDVIQREEWPDRPTTYVKKMKYPWYNSSGELLGTFGISCDVTSLVGAQKKLETLALDLKSINKKYEEDLVLAREIQHAILPENASDWEDKLTQWKHRVDIEHLYIPATELAGDYYDIISIDKHRIGFLIIDVMGHGVRSALIVSLIRGLLEQALPHAADPAAYMSQLNKSLSAILARTTVTMFASACYMLLDFENNVASITNAGHDSPLMQFSSEPLERNIIKSPALGFFEDAVYHSTDYDIENLEKLMLFTDGIYEIPNSEDEDWGKQRLQASFKKEIEASIAKTQQRIYKEALAWTGGRGFDDDVCLIGVQLRKGKESS